MSLHCSRHAEIKSHLFNDSLTRSPIELSWTAKYIFQILPSISFSILLFLPKKVITLVKIRRRKTRWTSNSVSLVDYLFAKICLVIFVDWLLLPFLGFPIKKRSTLFILINWMTFKSDKWDMWHLMEEELFIHSLFLQIQLSDFPLSTWDEHSCMLV